MMIPRLPSKTSNGKPFVRFAPAKELCKYQPAPEVEIDEERCWYQDEDFNECHFDARDAIEEAIRGGHVALIEQTYGHTDDKNQQQLNQWAINAETARGLERFANEEYGRQRLLHRRKAIQAVMYAQDRLGKDGQEAGSSRTSLILSTVSSTLSANAIEFAKMLAVADREAVIQQEDDVNAFAKYRARPANRKQRRGKKGILANAPTKPLRSRKGTLHGRPPRPERFVLER